MARVWNASMIALFATTLWSSGCAPLPPVRVATRPETTATRPDLAEGPGPADAEVDALLVAHNRRRADAGLPPLTLSAKLSAAAKVQAEDMAGHSKMSHSGTDGSTPSQRIERQGYKFRKAAENVAYGQPDADAVMTSWMDSPHHKENILGDYTEMGASKVLDKGGVPYWCVDFGRPWPSIAPQAAAESALKAINDARVAAKLPPMARSAELEGAADRRAKLMATRGGFDAKEDDGKSALQRLAEERRFLSLSEGDAFGSPTADDLIRGWLKDDDQKKNVLGDFDAVGIGRASTADGTPYWSLIFGKIRK